MSRLPRFALLLLVLATASGCALSIATVSAPDINCRFDEDCTITVDDSVGDIPVPAASAQGRLQSRTFPPGEPGTPGEGLHAYVYRVDLTQVAGATAIVCVDSLSLDFGPIERLDYDLDGDLDHVWVTTGGGLGSVGPSSARRSGDRVTFRFQPGVCPGNAPGNGDTSYFFGLASTDPPQTVPATVGFGDGTQVTVDARAPQ
jgi:hypothetical protein